MGNPDWGVKVIGNIIGREETRVLMDFGSEGPHWVPRASVEPSTSEAKEARKAGVSEYSFGFEVSREACIKWVEDNLGFPAAFAMAADPLTHDATTLTAEAAAEQLCPECKWPASSGHASPEGVPCSRTPGLRRKRCTKNTTGPSRLPSGGMTAGRCAKDEGHLDECGWDLKPALAARLREIVASDGGPIHQVTSLLLTRAAEEIERRTPSVREEAYRGVLEAIRDWDMLNPPQVERVADLAWLRSVVDAILSGAPELPAPTLDRSYNAVMDLLTVEFPDIEKRRGPEFLDAIVAIVQMDRLLNGPEQVKAGDDVRIMNGGGSGNVMRIQCIITSDQGGHVVEDIDNVRKR